MAKKKKDRKNNPFKPVDEQVMEKDTITIADVKQFITDSKKKRQDFLSIADASWQEIEKRDKKGRLYGGNDLSKIRKWSKFPLWWSCWKIRKAIVFARLPLPTLKDTQGDDPFGRTACVLGERFTRSILKTFEPFPEFDASVDDLLVTNFGWGRACYRKSECIEDEKVYLQMVQPEPEMQEPMVGPDGLAMEAEPLPPPPPIFLTPDGEEVDQSLMLEDEFGPYILTGQKVSIDNEEVYFESQLYSNYYADPDARRSSKRMREAYEYQYSYREFKEKFGQAALDKLVQGDIEEHKTGKPIITFEYWDKFLKEVRWFAENSEDFFQPQDIANIPALKEIDGKQVETVDNSDLYGLSNFFPCTDPLIINQSTKEFWPIPEFFQVQDILDDINSIVGRMILLTRAIRCRFLFDSSVTQLAQLAGETGEAGGLGVPNLAETLMNGNGDLSRLVAYFPVKEMIEGLKNMYDAFSQRLDMFYQVTGISDLIRGQTNPDSDKTFGERQMEGKFALNRMEEPQRKVQEWIKDNYQLLMEMGLKMFSDKSIDEYITPQTLDPEDRERYVAALELLKNNKRRRFRVDFETDSTIAINEQWKRQQAIETANVITKMQESVAKTAETMPELAESQLKIMDHVIGELTDGKLFRDEIQDSIREVIEKVKAPKEPEFNADEASARLEEQKFLFEQQKQIKQDQFQELQIQADQAIEIEKIKRDERLANLEAQLTQFKISVDAQTKQMATAAEAEKNRNELEKEYQEISANIIQFREQLEIDRGKLLVELRKVADKKEVDQMALMIDARVAESEKLLETARLQLEESTRKLDLQERWATELRLQKEDAAKEVHSKLDGLQKIMEVALMKKELDAPHESEKPKEEKKPEKPKKRRSKVKRDKNDNIVEIVHEDVDD